MTAAAQTCAWAAGHRGKTAPAAAAWRRGPAAVVVFTDRTDIAWLRLLRRGFRHCFAVVQADGAWVVVDPLSHYTTLSVVPELAGWDPETWFRHLGFVVLPTEVREPPHRLAPWRPYTCVEAVKRVLGLHLPQVFTPWQLYVALGGDKNHNIEENYLDSRPVHDA